MVIINMFNVGDLQPLTLTAALTCFPWKGGEAVNREKALGMEEEGTPVSNINTENLGQLGQEEVLNSERRGRREYKV